MVWARVFYGSMRAYQKGDSYLKGGRHIEAVTFFDRSMHWYAPLNPYVRKSAERLWEIGKIGQERGDIRLALVALKAIKRGLLGARSFYTPGRDWIEKCDLRIQELLRRKVGEETGAKADGFVDAMLERSEGKPPDVMWSIVLLVGLFGWVISLIAIIMRPVEQGNEKGRLWGCRTLEWTLCAIIFYALWILGMMNA